MTATLRSTKDADIVCYQIKAKDGWIEHAVLLPIGTPLIPLFDEDTIGFSVLCGQPSAIDLGHHAAPNMEWIDLLSDVHTIGLEFFFDNSPKIGQIRFAGDYHPFMRDLEKQVSSRVYQSIEEMVERFVED